MTISIQIRDVDLKKRHPLLANELWSSSTAVVYSDAAYYATAAPTILTVNCDDIVGATIDADADLTGWVGQYIIIVGKGEGYKITAADYTAAVEPAEAHVDLTLEGLSATELLYEEDTTSIQFQIFGYTDMILEAFKVLEDDLTDRGYDLDELTATRTFREAQLCKSFELIFRDFYNQEGDKYYVLMNDYARRYTQEMSNTLITDDEDNDGFTLGTKIQL